MATVTGLTAARMAEIEAASVVDGSIVGNHLILEKHGGGTIDAGPLASDTAYQRINLALGLMGSTFSFFDDKADQDVHLMYYAGDDLDRAQLLYATGLEGGDPNDDYAPKIVDGQMVVETPVADSGAGYPLCLVNKRFNSVAITGGFMPRLDEISEATDLAGIALIVGKFPTVDPLEFILEGSIHIGFFTAGVQIGVVEDYALDVLHYFPYSYDVPADGNIDKVMGYRLVGDDTLYVSAPNGQVFKWVDPRFGEYWPDDAVGGFVFEIIRPYTTLATDAEPRISGFAMGEPGTPPELPVASETEAGIIEIADDTEVLAGTDAERAVTPLGLTSRLTDYNTTLMAALGGLVQPLDDDLTAIAGLGTDPFGRDLLTKTTSAAVRTYLGLVIGTDVQAYDATLADAMHKSIAGEINAMAAKSVPVGADIVMVEDSEDSWARKKLTLAAIIALAGDLAPALLNTIDEIAAALGDDPNFATTMTTLLSGKVNDTGDTLTGALLFPDGSGTVPSIGFSSDPDTGFRWFTFAGANYVDLLMNGSYKVRFSSGSQAHIIRGGSEATAADGTGIIQVGDSATANLGLDGSEIQARNNSVASQLDLNPHGGVVTVGGTALGTLYQAADTDLGAIAALTSAADKIPYATGVGTWAMTDFTVFARSLIDDVNAAAARRTLEIPIVARARTSGGTAQVGKPGVTFLPTIQVSNITAGVDFFEPFEVNEPITLDQMLVDVSTVPATDSTLYYAVYALDANMQPTGAPVLADSLVVTNAGSTGVKTDTISQALTPGLYAVAYNASVLFGTRYWAATVRSLAPALGGTTPFNIQYWAARANAAFPNPSVGWSNTTTLGSTGEVHRLLLRWS